MTRPESSSDTLAVEALQRVIRSLPRRAETWVRASENSSHIGALLADAALQPGLDYRSVVEPRVNRIRQEYGTAASVSGLLAVLQAHDATTVLGIANARKCGVFRDLALLLHSEGIETAVDLRSWLERSGSRAMLVAIHGVGIKTAAYLRLLSGLPAIAIDVHLRRTAEEAGVHRSDGDLERLYAEAAAREGIPLAELDGALWQDGNDRRRRGSS